MGTYEATESDQDLIDDSINGLELWRWNEETGNNKTNRYINTQILEYFLSKWDEVTSKG